MSDFPALPFEQAIKKASALNAPKTILIYGDPKRGKSWLAASASEIAELSPVLFIDTEGGSSAIARDWPDVEVIDGDTHEKLDVIITSLLTQKHKYKTVIIDTLGVAMDRAEKFFGDKPENRNNKFGKWGDLKEWITDTTRKLHSAPFLSILVAHGQDEKDDQTGAVKTVPMLPGSAKNTLPAIPDIIGYLSAEADGQGSIHRVLYLQSSDRLVSGNRFGLPAKMVDPSILKIMQAIPQGGNN
ncbi:phage_P_loop, phage nucleotide-binding protein [uncultured Caudovirales phage]|uniref:Phage_P_loop, phage nucleotide-binding protein n=1 Tax=uncultured Caudovirales phage TaxID=2100421 RepID=A0A6J5MVI1_9CAUD|nr:phage_P_loop, phage nucleotide-binding protein [uncultured Caudovirales phage]